MPIYEKTPNYDEVVKHHPFFLPDIWKTVLNCCSDMEAMQLDRIYGGHQTVWLMRERIVDIPCSQTWLTAIKERSLGMMLYLVEYGVPCPYFSDIMQYAVDKNQLEILVFVTADICTFRDGHGNIIKNDSCPSLDNAIVKNYIDIVQYVFYKFPFSKYAYHYLEKPVYTLAQIMRDGLYDMLKLLVPKICQINSDKGLKLAIANRHYKIVKYVLNNNIFTNDLDDKLMRIACSTGDLKIVKLLEKYRVTISNKSFDIAFQNGHTKLVRYIMSKYQYIPSKNDMKQACLKGFFKVMCLVPKFVKIHKDCLTYSIKSGVYEMAEKYIELVPNTQFVLKNLEDAIKSASCDMFIFVYFKGGFRNLPTNLRVMLFTNRMIKSINFIHKQRDKIYDQNTFMESCRICDYKLIVQNIEIGKVKLDDTILKEGARKVFVSTFNMKERLKCYTYLTNILNVYHNGGKKGKGKKRVKKSEEFIHNKRIKSH